MGLTKRKDSFYVEFRVITAEDGKTLRLASGVQGAKLKRWKVGCLNRTVAKEMEATIKTNLMLGKVLTEEAKPVLFSEWAKEYLNLEEVRSLRSYQDRIEIVDKQLVPFFGKKIITEVTPEDVRAFRGQRKRRDGEQASLQTVNNDHIVLKHCLNVACKRGLLSSNPATKVPMPDPQNERDRVLSEDEWQRLYQAAKPHLRPIMLIAYHLGQRLGEILRLTWDRVDTKRGFITLRAVDTKTKKPRQVPMTPEVRTALQALAKVRQLTTKHVFTFQGKPVGEIKTAFNTAKQEAGISDLRFHDLRHCAATNLRRAGVSTEVAMAIVGHKSDRCWRRYNAVQERDLLQAASKLQTYHQDNRVSVEEEKTSHG